MDSHSFVILRYELQKMTLGASLTYVFRICITKVENQKEHTVYKRKHTGSTVCLLFYFFYYYNYLRRFQLNLVIRMHKLPDNGSWLYTTCSWRPAAACCSFYRIHPTTMEKKESVGVIRLGSNSQQSKCT